MLTFLKSAIGFSTIFLFGSTGETITEKSGHLNLGTPGIMCLGALGGCVGENLYLKMVGVAGINGFAAVIMGILFAMLFAAFGGAIYGFLTITLRCNQNVTGLSITTFGAGVTNFFINYVDRTGFVYLSKCFKAPIYAGGDWFSTIFLSHGVLVYTAIALALLVAFVLKKTRGGLNLTAIGENPATADAAGINVTAYKYTAVLTGSAISGLGGLYYIMDYLDRRDGLARRGSRHLLGVEAQLGHSRLDTFRRALHYAQLCRRELLDQRDHQDGTVRRHRYRAYRNEHREPQRIPAARLPRIILFQRGTVAEDTNTTNFPVKGTPLRKGRFRMAKGLRASRASSVSHCASPPLSVCNSAPLL